MYLAAICTWPLLVLTHYLQTLLQTWEGELFVGYTIPKSTCKLVLTADGYLLRKVDVAALTFLKMNGCNKRAKEAASSLRDIKYKGNGPALLALSPSGGAPPRQVGSTISCRPSHRRGKRLSSRHPRGGRCSRTPPGPFAVPEGAPTYRTPWLIASQAASRKPA